MSTQSSVRVTFYGAAGEVTGSKYLVQTDEHHVLIDCGLFQGKKELRQLNWGGPKFDSKEIDAIVLTHAHIDHIGYLPVVVKAGFKGPIYCTAATKELCDILLLDSAHLQEEDAAFMNRHGTSKHKPALPLYDQRDAEKALMLLRTIPRDKPTQILPGITVTPRSAGHILGSTSLTLDVGGKRLSFSGDIGRYDTPLIPDPAPIEFGDLLLCESTYGDRLHPSSDPLGDLEKIVKRAIDRKGPLLIPAFAVGRTQSLLNYFAQLERAGRIPELDVFVDSPMAVNATHLYSSFQEDRDVPIEQRPEDLEPMLTARTTFCRTVDESKRINGATGTSIIISASGMATGGRILHHLKHWLPREEATVLFVGFQAEGTRGRTILDGSPDVKIFGNYVPIRAHVENMSSMSAHGDYSELIRWLKSGSGSPKHIKIVHGEKQAGAAFVGHLQQQLGWQSSMASYLETIDV